MEIVLKNKRLPHSGQPLTFIEFHAKPCKVGLDKMSNGFRI